MMNKKFIKNLYHRSAVAKMLLCASALLPSALNTAKAQWTKVGTGTVSNTATTYPTPFGGSKGGQRAQYVYTKTELVAAGYKPGWIDSLGFLVTNTNGAIGHADLRFYVDRRGPNSNPLSGGFSGTPSGTPPPKLTLRYSNSAVSYLPRLGWNNFGFTSPYYWDGNSDILVSTCFWSGTDYRNASVEMTRGLTGFVASRTRADPSTPSVGIAICEVTTLAASDSSSNRPNIQFRLRADTCTTKPVAGKATASVPQVCIFDDSLEVGLVGNGLGYGLSFQWQTATTATGPWANYGPADSTRVNVKAKQTVSTYYRAVVICRLTGLRDTSAPVYVPMAPPYNCDCASEGTTAPREKVLSVKLAGTTNLSPCAVTSLGYTDYTTGARALPPIDLEPGTGYNLEMRLGSCDGVDNARAVKVFIDYDRSATYEVSEMVYANMYSASQPNPQVASGDFTVPLSTLKGLTTMRIVYGKATALSDISACGKYAQGETQDFPINILPFGKPTVTGRLTVCEHDSVVMNATSVADTPVVFTWTGPGGFTGVGPKITFVDASPSLTGTYYVTVTSGGITSSPREVEVTVYPKPPVPNVLNANMCQYSPSGKLITDGKNVIWYNVPVGGFGDTTAPTVPTYTPNTATYYLTQTVNGCVSDRGKVVVNVYLKPPPPVVKTPVTWCQLQDPNLVAKGDNLKWYLDSAGGVPSIISPTPPTGFPDEIDYYVSQTINGCESDRARVRVIVYDQPNGIILHSKPFVCQYDTATFFYYGNAPASDEYKWFTADAEFISGGGQGPVVYRFNEAGNRVVNLYVNNGSCATVKISDTITVRTAPTIKLDTVNNACVGVPTLFTVDSVTSGAYNYTFNWDGGILTAETQDGGPYYLYWPTSGYKNISVIVYNRTCPSLPGTKTIFVRDRPYAHINNYAKVTNYGRDTSVFVGKVCQRDTLVFSAHYNSTYKYKWTPEYLFDRDTVAIVSDRMRMPAFVTVAVEDEFGCKSADSVYINVQACCEMAMPNAFTPNHDGRNDRFRPIRDGRQDIITFRVVNRWGQTVFETANTDNEGWDGSFAGKDQDMGVYQYYIKYRCLDNQIYEMKGDVTLIR